MKKTVLLLIVVSVLSACSFEVHVLSPASPSSSVSSSATSTPHSESTESPTPTPGFTPSASVPLFYAAYFTLGKDDFPGRYAFPSGTKQVFAHWQFQNMRNGMLVRREWRLSGEPWLTREESWDEARYGVYGLMPDISVYDLDAGLPSGKYELRLYIDGVIQPIGAMVNGQPESWVQFEILPEDSTTGIVSPDGKWRMFLSNGTKLIVQDTLGAQREIYGGVRIVSRAWMPDSRHILFVDQNPNGAPVGPSGSLPGTLLIVDSRSLAVRILYSSETVLGEAGGGLLVSPDGKFVAAIEGTGYGDACFLDSQLIFFEIADNYQTANIIRQNQFTGIPASNRFLYVTAVGGWSNNTQFSVPMSGTCSTDVSVAGMYTFDIPSRIASLQPSVPTTLIAGDLGWGEIHGVVTDAATGMAIPSATVTCTHSSYTSRPPLTCSGSVVTSIPGIFIFQRVFFHDTDSIKLTVTAPGYQAQEFTHTGFTTNDLMVTFSLTPLP